MKFKATFRSSQLIHKLCQTFEKVHKMALIQFSERVLTYVVRGEVGQEPQVWIQLRMDEVFSEFNIQSNHDNKIYIELEGDHWTKSLKESLFGITTTLKLVRIEGDHRVLRMTIDEKSSAPGKFNTLTHDIPVRILQYSQFTHIRQPETFYPSIKICLPTLLSVRYTIDRLKTLGGLITLKANLKGFFSTEMYSEKCSITTTYPPQCVPNDDDDANTSMHQPTEIEKQTIVSTTIDIRHFAYLLDSYQLNPYTVIISYSQNSNILAKIMLNNDEFEDNICTIDYFIPYQYQ